MILINWKLNTYSLFQATLYEESQSRLKLSMELDTKESELENLQLKFAHVNLDTASLSSGTGKFIGYYVINSIFDREHVGEAVLGVA